MVNENAEVTLLLSDIKPDEINKNKNDSNQFNQEFEMSFDENKSNSSLDVLSMEIDDISLNKARKLSLEADAVLQTLQMLKDLPPEPVPEAVKEPDTGNNLAQVTTTSPSPSKHKDKYRNVSKHKLSVSKKVKEEKKSKDEKSEKRHHKDKHNCKGDLNKNKEITTKKAEKVDLAGLVVKLLMPYYKKKKISSRDLFKTTARHIVHQLLAIQVTGMLESRKYHIYEVSVLYCLHTAKHLILYLIISIFPK